MFIHVNDIVESYKDLRYNFGDSNKIKQLPTFKPILEILKIECLSFYFSESIFNF